MRFFFFFLSYSCHVAKLAWTPPLAMSKGKSVRERDEKETTKTAALVNTHMVYFCVFFLCCMTEALGIWMCDSVEDSDP